MPRTIATDVWNQFSEACDLAQNRQQLLDAFTKAMNAVGYDRVNVSLMRDFDMPETELGFGLVNTYPEDWQTYYIDKGCVRFDPVAMCAKGYISPFAWRHLGRLLTLTPLQKSFLSLAEEAGLHNGVGLPFMGPQTLVGGVALATSTRSGERLEDLNLLWSFSSLLYRRWREVALNHNPRPLLVMSLTNREIDVLKLSTDGLTDREVGGALAISENTVNAHLRNIYRKLNVKSRLQALATAVKLGIISKP